jgi:hypothetical protein
MDTPKQFRNIARRMHQGIDRLFPADVSTDDLMRYLVSDTPRPEREAVARFIDTLLSSNLSKEELTAIWAKAGSDWCVSEPHVASFLEQLRDALRLETTDEAGKT